MHDMNIDLCFYTITLTVLADSMYHIYRPAVVTCVKTDESESVVLGYANSFRRPPTVGQFRVTSGQSKYSS